MDLLTILGYLSALVIGISLGLIGGGGSILTVPAMVYMLSVSPVLATAYSLFVVGVTSLAGSFSFMKKGLVNYKTAAVFATPSFLAVFLTRKFLVPSIPEEIFSVGDWVLTKDIAIMVFFALIMLAASFSMIKNNKRSLEKKSGEIKFNFPLIAAEGAVVGVLTGLVGAGGGFLIIPALVLLANLPMKMAVGTSLLIIAVKSLIGFLGDVATQEIDWVFLGGFTALSLVGIFVGSYLSSKIDGSHLKKGFGYFVLIMAVYILVKEMLF
ncbi:sulfite exporter TauE/SafE family protein [Litoribacter ruber]|uniref:Probable membrane transporter protein n=1 Tax=Litoribacter ruber TaxID=702568 RepID=A0AAP2CIJ2_9BACT|nr:MULTISPECIES: sulfite exporter TauE/SafE family protein [Litoribacter]MBS9525376.1 sulfite exporter TauE/SafE family protein [Litoribacter alkaliphilus]MBT0809762.1 sulfite exporter TauE/SafE family protein [Litoribacter ruber]